MTGDHTELFDLVAREVARARTLYPDKRSSLHEGLAFVYEEFTELQAAIFVKQPYKIDVLMEAVQTMATLVRLIEECDIIDVKQEPTGHGDGIRR